MGVDTSIVDVKYKHSFIVHKISLMAISLQTEGKFKQVNLITLDPFQNKHLLDNTNERDLP